MRSQPTSTNRSKTSIMQIARRSFLAVTRRASRDAQDDGAFIIQVFEAQVFETSP
jgi:hypothetical protein